MSKSMVMRLTLIDPLSIEAIEKCKITRKRAQYINEAIYNYVRSPEGQKSLMMCCGENIFQSGNTMK
jgi:hypothetical protein